MVKTHQEEEKQSGGNGEAIKWERTSFGVSCKEVEEWAEQGRNREEQREGKIKSIRKNGKRSKARRGNGRGKQRWGKGRRKTQC